MKTTFKILLAYALILLALSACKSVKKLSREGLRVDIQSDVVKKDSIYDFKVDGVSVKYVKDSSVFKVDSIYDDVIVIEEEIEYENGLPKKSKKKTTSTSKGRKTEEASNVFTGFDSSSVGIAEHSEIKDEARSDSAVAVIEKLNVIERKPSPINFGYLILFTAACVGIGIYIKSKNKFNPFV
jgi:hypothetical protein